MTVQQNLCKLGVILLICSTASLRNSNKIEDLILVRGEDNTACKDCLPVLYSTRYKILAAKVWHWIVFEISIIPNYKVLTKYWTILWGPVNCMWWVFRHTLERPQAFVVPERKNEGLRCVTIAPNALTGVDVWGKTTWKLRCIFI